MSLAAASRKILAVLAGAVVPLLALGLWQLAVSRQWLAEQLLPPPALVWASLRDLAQSGDLLLHLATSVKRILWSLLLGGGLGTALGFALGLSPAWRAYLNPTFQVVSQFPIIGWVPLLIIVLGLGEGLKVGAVTLAVFVPFTLNTARGVAEIPPAILEVARVYRLGRAATFLRVVLPACLPSLFTGLRQGLMQAWLSLVFIELLASDEGIGYLIVWGRQLLQMDLVVVGMAVIAAVGLTLELLLGLVERRILAWRRAWA